MKDDIVNLGMLMIDNLVNLRIFLMMDRDAKSYQKDRWPCFTGCLITDSLTNSMTFNNRWPVKLRDSLGIVA